MPFKRSVYFSPSFSPHLSARVCYALFAVFSSEKKAHQKQLCNLQNFSKKYEQLINVDSSCSYFECSNPQAFITTEFFVCF